MAVTAWVENGSDNLWSNPDNWSAGLPGNALFSAQEGPLVQTIDFDVSKNGIDVDFEDWDVGVLGIIRDLDATLTGRVGTQLVASTMTFSPSWQGFTQGVVAARFNNMDVRASNLEFENQLPLELGYLGHVRLFLGSNTEFTIVNAGSGGTVQPDAPVTAGNLRLEIGGGAVLTNVERGGDTTDQQPLVLAAGSALILGGGGELGWSTVTGEGAPFAVQGGGGRISASFIHPGITDLIGGDLTFGGSDPVFPDPTDPGTPVDRDPNAGNELLGLLSGEVKGIGGIIVDHPLYTVRTTNATNSFSGGIKILQGTFQATSGPATGSLSNFIQLGDGTYHPDGSYATGLNRVEFLAGTVGTIHTPDFAHVVTAPRQGSGDLRKTGAKELILNSSGQSFTGDYHVAEGKLEVALDSALRADANIMVDAGATLRFTNNIEFGALEGQGTFERSINWLSTFHGRPFPEPVPDFAGNVVSGGIIAKTSVGKQVFSGDNSGFTGEWQAKGGTLIFGGPNALVGTLRFMPDSTGFAIVEHSGGGTYSGSMVGSEGIFIKNGNNTLTLTGNNAGFSDLTLIDEGTLEVNNSTLGSDVYINAGGTLGGINGNLSDIEVRNGGVLAGRLNTGSVTAFEGGIVRPDDPNSNYASIEFLAGSHYEYGIEASIASSNSNTLNVAGEATLGGLLSIEFLDTGPGGQFMEFEGAIRTLIMAGSISGEFDNAPHGSRLTTVGGEGSYIVSYEHSVNAVFLRDFIAASLPGDFDEDGDVDGVDFLVWQRNPALGSLSDWETNYGSTSSLSAVSTVPEPTSILLLTMSLTLIWVRH